MQWQPCGREMTPPTCRLYDADLVSDHKVSAETPRLNTDRKREKKDVESGFLIAVGVTAIFLSDRPSMCKGTSAEPITTPPNPPPPPPPP